MKGCNHETRACFGNFKYQSAAHEIAVVKDGKSSKLWQFHTVQPNVNTEMKNSVEETQK